MTDLKIETHPLKPFLPENAKLLMLGSFPPPQKRWCMPFYYPNYQNDMWRIFGIVFFDDREYFVDRIKKTYFQEKIITFLENKGIAIFDTAFKVQRQKQNASDNFLKVLQSTDIHALLEKIPSCNHIMTTGDKATETLLLSLPNATPKPTLHASSSLYFAQRNLIVHRLPSSSRAYPLALQQKAEIYKNFFKRIGMLN